MAPPAVDRVGPWLDPAPDFEDDLASFDSARGFSILDFCSWNLFPQDKCADFGPQSGDCTAGTCPFTGG